MEIELSYSPLILKGGEISERDYDLYIAQPVWISVAKKFAIEPLETSMKESEQESFDFDDFKVTKKLQKRKSITWEKVYTSLIEFLKIRADDSRAFDMEGVKPFEGIGYCILITDLRDFIEKQMEDKTSKSEFYQLFWPRKKKEEEYPHEIILPVKNYSVITPGNGRIVLKAKKFCSGLEAEVVNAFKDANQKWFEKETGYSLENLPIKEDSPVKRTKLITRKKPIFINLVREDVLEYGQIIGQLLTELKDLENNIALEGYKTKPTKQGLYVNIKNVYDRISKREKLEEGNFIKPKGRYEIVP